MHGNGYAQPEQQYAQYATEMSGGAVPAAGMPAYPLYGLPPSLGQTDETPIWRRPSVCFAAGAAVVGIAWAYFGWWRPKQAKSARVAKNATADEEK